MTWMNGEVKLQDRNAYVSLDSRFEENVPFVELPCINWFGIWARSPTPLDAYFPEDEEKSYLALERRLIEIAGETSDGWAVYCMRVLSRGIAELYFYSKDSATLAKVLTALKAEFPNYRVEHEAKNDQSWSEYFKYLKAIR